MSVSRVPGHLPEGGNSPHFSKFGPDEIGNETNQWFTRDIKYSRLPFCIVVEHP
jgi:hypothetical protein